MKKEQFEDYLTQLEKIVAELEEGNLSLEESLNRYETGIKALKKCYEVLDNMEKKIEMLVKDEKGFLQPKPFKKLLDND
jgi:exodeoxyribonuclease VII small subunit